MMVVSKLDEIRRLKFQIKLLDEKIKELKSKLESQGIKYSDLPKTLGFKNNLIELQIEKLIEFEVKKEQLQAKIDSILEEFLVLPELPYRVAYYRRVDGLHWDEISRKIGYSISQCYRFYLFAQNFKT